MPQHATIHDSLYNAFSFGLLAAYELESENRELLQKLISEWRSQQIVHRVVPARSKLRGSRARRLAGARGRRRAGSGASRRR